MIEILYSLSGTSFRAVGSYYYDSTRVGLLSFTNGRGGETARNRGTAVGGAQRVTAEGRSVLVPSVTGHATVRESRTKKPRPRFSIRDAGSMTEKGDGRHRTTPFPKASRDPDKHLLRSDYTVVRTCYRYTQNAYVEWQSSLRYNLRPRSGAVSLFDYARQLTPPSASRDAVAHVGRRSGGRRWRRQWPRQSFTRL